MAEFVAIAEQTVAIGQSVVFTDTTVPCRCGLISHYDDSGLLVLQPFNTDSCGCCCNQNSPEYLVAFHANIAVPEGGTLGEINLAVQMGGVVIPASIMAATPTVAEAYFNVGTDGVVPLWGNCCQNLTIVNTSLTGGSILVKNARLRVVPNNII